MAPLRLHRLRLRQQAVYAPLLVHLQPLYLRILLDRQEVMARQPQLLPHPQLRSVAGWDHSRCQACSCCIWAAGQCSC